ncbi:hypothetical protein NP493_636g03007 [Ridgeia piscesae]|uniref:Uncharacterized protein n=1 Tax=Ridgeia piscesae TaxID=27915 RepID=A0AAD9KT51_RIDPI|nr:hypothetical protein NP493_636g03007 [Ridgeia piscesae]
MMENDTPIYVNNTQIENVESYIYLGQRYSTRDKKQDKEIQRKITTAFARHRDNFKGSIQTCLKSLQLMCTSGNDIQLLYYDLGISKKLNYKHPKKGYANNNLKYI